jgi:hypothetical protein
MLEMRPRRRSETSLRNDHVCADAIDHRHAKPPNVSGSGAELPGYPDYAARVRYRFVPGVW